MSIKIDVGTGKVEVTNDVQPSIPEIPTLPPTTEDRLKAVEDALLNLMG